MEFVNAKRPKLVSQLFSGAFVGEHVSKQLGAGSGRWVLFPAGAKLGAVTLGLDDTVIPAVEADLDVFIGQAYETNFEAVTPGVGGNSIRVKYTGNFLATTIAFANAIKATYNAHRGNLAIHVTGSPAVTSADATDLTSLITLVTEIQSKMDVHIEDALLSSGRVYHSGPTDGSTQSLASTTPPTDLAGCITILVDLKAKHNLHDSDAGEGTHDAGNLHQESATNSQALSVSVSVNDITLNLETSDGVILTDAGEAVGALNGNGSASALITSSELSAGGDSTSVSEFDFTNLTGGDDGLDGSGTAKIEITTSRVNDVKENNDNVIPVDWETGEVTETTQKKIEPVTAIRITVVSGNWDLHITFR